MTVKLWADPETDGERSCCSPEAVLGARALAHSLGIPHLTLDLRRSSAPASSSLARRLRRRADAEPLHPLQRRSAARGDARPGGAARRQPLVTGHYARIVEDGDGAAAAAGGRRGQGPELHARRRCRRTSLGAAALPAHRAEQSARCATIAARDGLRSPSKPRVPGPLLPRRAGQGASCAATAAWASARARSSTRRARARPPPRPPQLHGRAAPRDRRRRAPSRSTCSPPSGRQHGHGRHPRGAADAPRSASATRPAPRRRQRRQRASSATTGALPAASGPAAPGRHARLEHRARGAFERAAPGQTAC